jgi:AcrR family transcriptional regulator
MQRAAVEHMPSVYNHFPSKHRILIEAMLRGHARLRAGVHAATQADTPDQTLRGVTNSYLDLALDDSDLVTVLIGESIHVTRADRGQEMRASQRAYIDDWVGLLRTARPAQSSIVAGVKVRAAQMIANDVGRTRRLRRVPGLRATVREACWAVQQAP